MTGENEDTEYEVVVNDEEQYSIWPAASSVPEGRRTVGRRGPKQRCLSWIEENWTDMPAPPARDAACGGTGAGMTPLGSTRGRHGDHGARPRPEAPLSGRRGACPG
ncbi:MbtH family protein, partial [Amycolatopsis cihanbeyliensis]